MRALLRFAALAICLPACSLVIQNEVDEIRRDYDGGPGTSGDGGPGTSGDGGPGVDGGSVCPRDSHTILSCQAVTLGDGGAQPGFAVSSLAAGDVSFIAAFLQNGRVELRSIDPTGTVLASHTLSLPGVIPDFVAVGAQKAHWGVIWSDSNLNPPDSGVACASDSNPNGVWLDTNFTGGPITEVFAAVSDNGGVGFTALGPPPLSDFGVGESSAGCPAFAFDGFSFGDLFSAAIIAPPPAVGETWALVSTRESAPDGGGELWFSLDLPDAGQPPYSIAYAANSLFPQDLAAALSTDGGTAWALYQATASLGSGPYQLYLQAFSTQDATNQSNPVLVYNLGAGAWGLSACGPGCMVSTFYDGNAPNSTGPITLAFTSDDWSSTTTPLGTYDLACTANLGNAFVSVAYAAGKVGLLYTTPNPSVATLYLCDLPPL